MKPDKDRQINVGTLIDLRETIKRKRNEELIEDYNYYSYYEKQVLFWDSQIWLLDRLIKYEIE